MILDNYSDEQLLTELIKRHGVDEAPISIDTANLFQEEKPARVSIIPIGKDNICTLLLLVDDIQQLSKMTGQVLRF